ncbi:MAG: XRE family transcriptional regulator [Flavobacteriales bacterium]|mgnify:FL=1|nr:MAG: XRE family transcriptional regulator [Flavobacteriales bacterium]
MTKLRDLHTKWSKEPSYRKAYDALDEEFALAEAIAEARGRAGLTQAEVAERMHTTQSNIARMEAGRTTPSTRTLEKFAQAIGAKLKISFEPVRTR